MEKDILNGNATVLQSLIGRTVEIETVDNCKHIGTIYVVDPVSKTIVLSDNKTSSLEFILNHALKTLTFLTDVKNSEFLSSHNNVAPITVEVAQQKGKIIKWLKQSFIDVKEDGDLLRVEEHVVICPPYSRNECMCENTIVLERIWNIIDSMPGDFQ